MRNSAIFSAVDGRSVNMELAWSNACFVSSAVMVGSVFMGGPEAIPRGIRGQKRLRCADDGSQSLLETLQFKAIPSVFADLFPCLMPLQNRDQNVEMV